MPLTASSGRNFRIGDCIEMAALKDESSVCPPGLLEHEAVDVAVPPEKDTPRAREIPRDAADLNSRRLATFGAPDALATELVTRVGLKAVKPQPHVVDAKSEAFELPANGAG